MTTPPPAEFCADFDAIESAERDWVARRRSAADVRDDNGPVGLALSGGGIRSATFNLGVLQGLEENGLLKQVDFMSSVSGGGYIASCLTWLRTRTAGSKPRGLFAQPTADGNGGTVLDWLRAHGKYLVAERGFSGWTLGASIFASVLLNLLVMLPPLLLLLGLATLDWLPVTWPSWAQIEGAGPVRAHDGYALALWSGAGSLLLFLVMAVVFAFVGGVRSLRTHGAVLRVRRLMGWFLSAGVALLAIGLIPLVVTAQEATIAYVEIEWLRQPVRFAVVALLMAGGVGIMRRADSKSRADAGDRRGLATVGLAILIYGLLMFGYHLVVHAGALQSPWLLASLLLSVAIASLCDLNWVSMHSYYRSRLAAAFMPPVEAEDKHAGGCRRARQFRLADIEASSGAPYHIVNTTLNTVSSKNQKLRGRGAESFTLTPLYCGSTATGYRATSAYRRGRTTLSTAFTVSGAAVDPNTDETRSRPVAFLMALLNFRLGFWAPNPRARQRRMPLPWWYVFIGREMLGHGLDETTRHVHLSDGGHFDNLGLYELLRRKCRHIIVCDAGADPETTLSDLGKVVQRARVDFGVNVDIDADHLRRQAQLELSQTPFAVGRIAYADGSEGEILYIKPLMRECVSVDIYAYWRANPLFPNQSTANQFFGEAQFSAYRELGRQIVAGIAGTQPLSSITDLIARARLATADPAATTMRLADAPAQRRQPRQCHTILTHLDSGG